MLFVAFLILNCAPLKAYEPIYLKFAIMIQIKRVYDTPQKDDGYRVLVDRLWPRGISKENAKLDEWIKEISPSHELRTWFGHDERKWEDFKQKYREELKSQASLLKHLKSIEKEHTKVSLLFAAKTEARNNAVVLKSVLDGLE